MLWAAGTILCFVSRGGWRDVTGEAFLVSTVLPLLLGHGWQWHVCGTLWALVHQQVLLTQQEDSWLPNAFYSSLLASFVSPAVNQLWPRTTQQTFLGYCPSALGWWLAFSFSPSLLANPLLPANDSFVKHSQLKLLVWFVT